MSICKRSSFDHCEPESWNGSDTLRTYCQVPKTALWWVQRSHPDLKQRILNAGKLKRNQSPQQRHGESCSVRINQWSQISGCLRMMALKKMMELSWLSGYLFLNQDANLVPEFDFLSFLLKCCN
ncbi:Btb/Poz Domain-Containing Protein 3 [Manis pentadactyla]|nr:Btb/Poz Domain-Containing Protein 3 [Manis pentadactyla]